LPQFFFPVDYDGFRYEDDRGEVFTTTEEAEAHATCVAVELSRNNAKRVTVCVVAADRFRVLQRVARGNPHAARLEPTSDSTRACASKRVCLVLSRG
jgi:hypothetical protein